jgi:two-component system, OmpR family, response regulator ResD
MSRKILIIDDETRVGKLLKMYLEKEDFKIDMDENGIVGLETALMQDFDLIILDLLLPGKNGFKVLEKLRKKKTTPVIFISSVCGDYVKKRALEYGANEYVLMPFSPREIVLKIKGLLSESNSMNYQM